jgi:hypothetical protein
MPLDEVADLPKVRRRYQRFRVDVARGLELFRESARLDQGVVVFDVDAADTIVPRYAPYYFWPEARYSVGVVRRGGSAKITAMRNPWLEFSGVHLGRMFEEFGGGTNAWVGSPSRGHALRAEVVLDQLLRVSRTSGAVAYP